MVERKQKIPTPFDTDRSNLAKIYPSAKTQEQVEQDDRERRHIQRRRWPRYPSLMIATYGSVVMGCIVWAIQRLKSWWFASTDVAPAMSAIFFSFALMLVLMSLFVAWIFYINKLFSYFGGKPTLFWFGYGIILLGIALLWLEGWVLEYTNIVWIPTVVAVNFVGVGVVARCTLEPSSA